MRTIGINIIMAIASLMIIGFAYWTYNQSVYDNKVKDYFHEKSVTNFNNLKAISSLSERLILIKGEIVADETFLSKKGKKVVLERFLEETKNKNSKKDWKEIKDTKFFKVLPFWLKNKSDKVLIDAFGFDKTYLGEPELKTEELNDSLKRTKLWILEPGQTVYILGNIENKAGQLIINSPNLYKSNFNPLAAREPYIITSLSLFEVTNKANDISKSVYNVSLALLAVGAFFLFSSVSKLFKASNKLSGEE